MNFLKTLSLLVLLALGSAFVPGKPSFEDTQKGYERVKTAYENKEDLIKERCRSLDVPEDKFGNMLIRAFKQERILEIWVQNQHGKYVKFKEFHIYALSGLLGPKRQEGDRQVPEGFYYINDFNPQSDYHLSLGINYPNESDIKLSAASRKGGDIYIHGSHVSAGCLAMSDFYIEDIYICAVKAHSNGQQKIPVEIFPFKMTSVNMEYYSQYTRYKQYAQFWDNLAEGYQFFERNNHPPNAGVSAHGSYQFTYPAGTEAAK